MGNRIVFSNFFKGNSTPWANANILFTLVSGSLTNLNFYPEVTLPSKTDENGYAEIELFCNEDGQDESHWICTTPDYNKFQFNVPTGSRPISLGTTKIVGIEEGTDLYKTLSTYIDEQIEIYVNSEGNGDNSKFFSELKTATSSLSALRIIRLSDLTYASADEIEDLSSPLAVTTLAVASSNQFRALLAGEISDDSWNWDINLPIYLGLNGFPTQTIDFDTFSFIKVIGSPISSTSFQLKFEPSIKI
ncbi:MAG: hypothetical protein AAF316_00125 [Cyanobacteria bacterium P01_A01_bin.80]